MKKTVLVLGLLLFAAGIVCAQEDMTYQHFYESMQFIANMGTIPYGVVSNINVLDDDDDFKEMQTLDTDNDGFLICELGRDFYNWSFTIINLRTRQYVMVGLSNAPNFLSNIDEKLGKGYSLANAGQRTAFLNDINAAKTRLGNTAR